MTLTLFRALNPSLTTIATWIFTSRAYLGITAVMGKWRREGLAHPRGRMRGALTSWHDDARRKLQLDQISHPQVVPPTPPLSTHLPSPLDLSQPTCSPPGRYSLRSSAAALPPRPARYAAKQHHDGTASARLPAISAGLNSAADANRPSCSPPRSPSSVPPVALASRSPSSSSSTPGSASLPSTTSVLRPVRPPSSPQPQLQANKPLQVSLPTLATSTPRARFAAMTPRPLASPRPSRALRSSSSLPVSPASPA